MNITEKQFRELLDRYLQDLSTPGEKKMLDAFFESYRKEYPDEEVLRVDDKHREEILSKIRQRIDELHAPARRGVAWWKVAAAIALLAIAYFFLDPAGEEPAAPVQPRTLAAETTARGEKSVIQLSDGTTVHLNSRTSLSFPETFDPHVREVELVGEAYFEVAHDASRPFVVMSHGVATRVLGTEFNVRAPGDDQMQITLVSGKVNVQTAGEFTALEPGQQAVIDPQKQTITTRHVDANKYTGWKNNALHFERLTASQAAVMMEDWYDVDIIIPEGSLEGCLITATYQDEPLENVLRSFQFLLKARVTSAGSNTFTISGQGCK